MDATHFWIILRFANMLMLHHVIVFGSVGELFTDVTNPDQRSYHQTTSYDATQSPERDSPTPEDSTPSPSAIDVVTDVSNDDFPGSDEYHQSTAPLQSNQQSSMTSEDLLDSTDWVEGGNIKAIIIGCGVASGPFLCFLYIAIRACVESSRKVRPEVLDAKTKETQQKKASKKTTLSVNLMDKYNDYSASSSYTTISTALPT